MTIAIADLHPVVRAGIRSWCAETGWCVVGESENQLDLLSLIREYRPVLAIVDTSLPGGEFAGFVARAAELHPRLHIVAHGASRDPESIRALLAAGISGYVLKDGPASQLSEAAAHISAGLIYISPSLHFSIPDEELEPDPAAVLSDREYQVFLRFGRGARPRDIAASLGVSAKTIDTYRSHILRKLKLDGMAALVRRASTISNR